MNPTLVIPSVKYKESFLEAIAEQDTSGLNGRLQGTKYEKFEGDFDAYLQYLKEESEGKNLIEGYVPQTVYWLVDGDKFIGRVHVRHILNEKLMNEGGHIGYSIRPSERMKGYGSIALKLILPKTRELGIESALLTCNFDNEASKKIIEKNGGIFENQIGDKLRFWVPIK